MAFEDRRTFLKSIAMATAVAGAHEGFASDGRVASLPVAGEDSGDGLKWDKAPCRFCGTGCHVMVGVKEGKVVAVAGDRKADVNKGFALREGLSRGRDFVW